MNIYKFRIIIDTQEDVFRDIEIATESTFLDLHSAILRAFNWEGGEMASFYMSNENWDKGQEIPLLMMNEDEDVLCMSNGILNKFLSRPDEKIIYVYDFLRMWCFYIELLEIKKAIPETLYPKISMIYGDAPTHESKEMDLFDGFDIEFDEPSKNDLTGDPELDEFLMDDDEDDNQPGFESLDDLEGLI